MNLVDLITAKAIQSKLDKRMATFIRVDNDDNIVLDIEKMGLRTLPKNTVMTGFFFHMDYTSLIKSFLDRQNIAMSSVYTDEDVHHISQDVYRIMSVRFKDITHKECYKAVREYLPV